MSEDKRKKASWKLIDHYSQWTGVSGLAVKYDLTPLFPEFTELTPLQQAVVDYGVKQKLSDATAGIGKDATDTDRAERMGLMYDRLLNDELNMPKSVGVKLMTKPIFMDQCERDGIPDEMAEKMWNMLRTKQD